MHASNFRDRLLSRTLLAACVLAGYAGTSWAGITNATQVMTESALALPSPYTPYNDPAFGTPTVRIGDPKAMGLSQLRPEYSQLQAWNASMSMLLVNTVIILDAKTFQRLHKIDFGWPATGSALRWSPTEPLSLYYAGTGVTGCSGAALMRYRLIVTGTPIQGQRELVRCFPEYTQFNKNASWEELSDDGRFIGLVGRRSDGTYDGFVYDIVNNVKHGVLQRSFFEWLSPSPSGKYVVVNWGGGGDARYTGVEAFDLEMRYLGKIATGHGHADLAIDKDGTEWYIDYSPDNYAGITGKVIKKNRLPNGYDAYKGGDKTAVVTLLEFETWSNNVHISCRNPKAGWCGVTTYGGGGDGRQPFDQEIFAIYFDSTPAAPHVDRLAHHRSITSSSTCNITSYWAQPHATVSPDATRIFFGSNWGRICDTSEPVEGFILSLPSTTAPADRIAPKAPTGIRVR